MALKVKHAQLATVDLEEEDRRELMVFRKRQLKWALESLREALDSHHRSLEGLESALIEFEAVLDCLVNKGGSIHRRGADPRLRRSLKTTYR